MHLGGSTPWVGVMSSVPLARARGGGDGARTAGRLDAPSWARVWPGSSFGCSSYRPYRASPLLCPTMGPWGHLASPAPLSTWLPKPMRAPKVKWPVASFSVQCSWTRPHLSPGPPQAGLCFLVVWSVSARRAGSLQEWGVSENGAPFQCYCRGPR